LSGYALINALWTTANDFVADLFLRMNTHSAREYTMFEPAQLLLNWCELRPSNYNNLDMSVMGEVGSLFLWGWTSF
jgi:hypothetical protein